MADPTYDEQYVDGVRFIGQKHSLAPKFEEAWHTPGEWVTAVEVDRPSTARRKVANLKKSSRAFPRGTYEVISRQHPDSGAGLVLVKCWDQDSPFTVLPGKRGNPNLPAPRRSLPT